ncbi:cytochrome P450 [Aeromicrobium duanguangcaii]|uniref:Cytochrome P450 n=1 Tax=Aeromicrobium duanguangcaii TaxID=2968086 RepID=A0ABY5KFQ6_9ACTN|nr:cytochrome P450 [Aeromicrobium duanguangcaii]MCD9153767.1 cytochrome P450 [Aeromicrobium duanguangcaii]UUI69155.1 cytochrome P450 [Aeromicrobium duanguangcaii]
MSLLTVRNSWSGHKFPHPPGRRPIAYDAMRLNTDTPVKNVMTVGGSLGPIFEVRVFNQKYVFVSDAALAAELCDESRFFKVLAPAVAQLRDFVGDGLFTALEGEQNWHTAHGVLMPAFSKAAMRGYHDTMLETAAEMFGVWDSQGGPIDVTADMTRLTLETISRCAFSRDFGSFTSSERHPFVDAMVMALMTGMQKGALDAVPGGGRIARRIDERNADQRAYLDDLVDTMVGERRDNGERHDDLLDRMLYEAHPETGVKLDDRNIREQILTFLVAGHETTSGALSFALYYLSRNPEILAKAHAEVDDLLGPDPDTEPTFEQVPRLRYLRRCLDETLRLWPTAPAFARSPRETTTVGAGTGHEVVMTPDDWAMIILPMTHRDPKAWGPTAEEFDPDRFLPENSRGRMKNIYKPFGTGERACIGRQFAIHEALLVLARLLHRYDITGEPDYELAIEERLTIVPQGFRLTLTPRTPAARSAEAPTVDEGPEQAPSGCPVAH